MGNLLQSVFNIVAVPFGYVMRFIYDLVGNYGVAIIIFTILTKLILLPLNYKQKKSSAKTLALQPKLKAIQKKYANDRDRYNQAVQELYDKEGVSPMAGCGTMFLTFPVLIGLYYVIQQPLTYIMHMTATEITAVREALEGLGVSFDSARTLSSQISVANAATEHFSSVSSVCSKLIPMDFNFLGINLSATPSIKSFSILWLIPLLSGLTALLLSLFMQKMQQRMIGSTEPQKGGKFMLLLSPLMSAYFAFILPAGLGLYWIVNNLITCLQEWLLTDLFIKSEKKKSESEKL